MPVKLPPEMHDLQESIDGLMALDGSCMAHVDEDYATHTFIHNMTYLDLGPPVPAGTPGDELSPSSTVMGNGSGHFVSVTTTDTHFLHIFCKCIPPCPVYY